MRNVLVRQKLLQQEGPCTATHAAPHFPNKIQPGITTGLKFDNPDQLHELTRTKKPLWLCRDCRQKSSMIILSGKMSTNTASTEVDFKPPSQAKAKPLSPVTGNSFSPSTCPAHDWFAVISTGNHSRPG